LLPIFGRSKKRGRERKMETQYELSLGGGDSLKREEGDGLRLLRSCIFSNSHGKSVRRHALMTGEEKKSEGKLQPLKERKDTKHASRLQKKGGPERKGR